MFLHKSLKLTLKFLLNIKKVVQSQIVKSGSLFFLLRNELQAWMWQSKPVLLFAPLFHAGALKMSGYGVSFWGWHWPQTCIKVKLGMFEVQGIASGSSAASELLTSSPVNLPSSWPPPFQKKRHLVAARPWDSNLSSTELISQKTVTLEQTRNGNLGRSLCWDEKEREREQIVQPGKEIQSLYYITDMFKNGS